VSAAAAATARAPLGLPRLLAGIRADGGAVSYEEHLRRHGGLPLDRDTLVELVARSGLTGRGGAAFPTATKLRAVRDDRRRPVVVVNGAEGEQISGKDTALLVYAPHLVIDGAVLAARAVDARRVIVATASGTAASTVVRGLAERRDNGVSFHRAVVPDRFVSGEETALVQFLNGGPCLPTTTPPRPFERGVGGAPTLVQNVETLAHLALLARHGADWFREVGTSDEPGSALVTLSGAIRRPGVYEITIGLTLAELLEEAGGATAELQAFLVGGFFGSWVRAEHARSARLSDAGLAPLGAMLGARAIVALPAAACGIAETARVARYLAGESAGQCGPCVHGLDAIAHDLDRLLRPRDRIDEPLLRRRLGVIPGRGACKHPDGAVRLVASALEVFDVELARHLRGQRCSGVGRPNLPVGRKRP